LYTVLFDVANTNGELMPQMTAQVFFVTARVENVITAPLSILQAVTGQSDVYTARVLDADGQITTREVRTGVRNRLTVEVLSGLAVDDKLVPPRPDPWCSAAVAVGSCSGQQTRDRSGRE
jgi:macrolide-specific efflux system membrane fusion protein